MSLVNDMLNDLDDRRNQHARNEVNLDWMTGQKQTSKNKWLMPLLSFAVIVLFITVAVATFRYQDTASSSVMDKLAAIKKAPAVVVDNESAPNKELKSKEISAVKVVVPPVSAESIAPKIEKIIATDNVPADNRSNVASEKISAPVKTVKKPKPLSLAQRDLKVSQDAKKLLRNNQPAAAEEKLAVFIQSNPLAVRSGKVLAPLWLSQKKYQQTQDLISPLRDLKPRDIDLIMIQARLYFSQQQLDQSMELLLTERPAVRKYADYYELLGFVARSNKQYEYSVQSYRALLEYDASRGDWWIGMAIALDMQSKKKLAKEAYRRGLDSRRISKSLSDYAKKRLAAL